MALAAMATPERVGNLLAQTVSDLETVDEDSLQQACDDANGIVLEHLMRSDIDDLTEWAASAVTNVATRVAARIYRNPRDLASYNFNDVGQSFTDPRILTPDEVRSLRSSRWANLRKTAVVLEPVPEAEA